MRTPDRPVAWAAFLLFSASWALAPASRAQSAPPRAEARTDVNWTRARALLSRYRMPVDTSGINEVDSELLPTLDAEDLEALCEGRKASIVSARRRAEALLLEQGDFDDPMTNQARAEAHRRLGSVASFTGDMEAAVAHFDAGLRTLALYAKEYPAARAAHDSLQEAAAVSQMRVGELQNCVVNPSVDRCLFPLRPGGRHQMGTGARDAMQRFRSLLDASPGDLDLRWLLNLSAALQGRPDAVPKAQRLEAEIFRSRASVPRFLDVAARTRLGRKGIAGGSITEDFDGDGLVDVMLSSVDMCEPLRLYRNRGDGRFEDTSEGAGLLGQLGGINAVQTDYNNDGKADVFIMRGGWEVPMRNSLLRNNGDGTFTDVTRAAGLQSGNHATHSAVWLDYDKDGWLDVFVGHEFTPSTMFRNRGDGTFQDVSTQAKVDRTAFTKGVTAGDYDKDGYPDLYVSNFMGENFLYHNEGNGTFSEVAVAAGVTTPLASFTTWFFDYDNDTRPDLFVVGFAYSTSEFLKHYLGEKPLAEPLTLYAGQPGGTFANVTEKAGLNRLVPSMGANFGDLDNDGFLDIYLGTGAPSFASLMPNVVLKNDGGRKFLDVTEATGMGHLQKGHGVAFSDLDNDGDQDVVVNVGGAVPGDHYEDALFENPGGDGNNWISIRLVGVKTNRLAIGARLTLRLRESGPGSPLRYREVTSGGSFGASSLTQHIGLGKAKAIDSLEIDWPVSGTRQVFRNLPVNRAIEIRELTDEVSLRELPRTRF
jgi:hypothetical protein